MSNPKLLLSIYASIRTSLFYIIGKDIFTNCNHMVLNQTENLHIIIVIDVILFFFSSISEPESFVVRTDTGGADFNYKSIVFVGVTFGVIAESVESLFFKFDLDFKIYYFNLSKF
jgi:hypothetical protein